MPPSSPSPKGSSWRGGWGERNEGDHLLALTLALEDSLAREAWDEADDLFAAREVALAELSPNAIPREVDDIDARILARLQRGQAEIRRETQALTHGRQAAVAYAGTPYRSNLKAA